MLRTDMKVPYQQPPDLPFSTYQAASAMKRVHTEPQQ